jgi:hypothetical protein
MPATRKHATSKNEAPGPRKARNGSDNPSASKPRKRRTPLSTGPIQATPPQAPGHQAGPCCHVVPTREQIAERAYFRFLARGAQHGHDLDDWVAAERELTGTFG